MNNNGTIGIKEWPGIFKGLTLSLQHLFAMFGSTVLVPILTDLDPSIALISSGIGTLAFLLITQGKVPAYLGSSFAYIIPLQLANEMGGIGAMMLGSMVVGIVYGIVALIIKKAGYHWLIKLLPPIVTGPVIMVIGLGLSATAVSMAMNNPAGEYDLKYFSAALVTLAVTIIFTVFFKGILNMIPILLGIVGGYLYSWMIGIVDFTGVKHASWFEMPAFAIPGVHYEFEFSTALIILMVPVAFVTITEHIGHQLVLGKVVDKDYIVDPGLHRSLLGDGLATFLSGIMGGPPKTTYGENIGVLAITRVYSVYVLAGAGIFAILFGFVGKFSALINSIPSPVMGGISILLFGIIAASGLRMLIESHTNLNNKKNLVISSVVLVIGIGGAYISLQLGDITFTVSGMALATIIGIVLNAILPAKEEVEPLTLQQSSEKTQQVL